MTIRVLLKLSSLCFLFVFLIFARKKKWATNVYDPSVCACVWGKEREREREREIVFHVTVICLTTLKQRSGASLPPRADTGWSGTLLNWCEAGHTNLLAHDYWRAASPETTQSTCRPTSANFFLCSSAHIKNSGLLATDILQCGRWHCSGFILHTPFILLEINSTLKRYM